MQYRTVIHFFGVKIHITSVANWKYYCISTIGTLNKYKYYFFQCYFIYFCNPNGIHMNIKEKFKVQKFYLKSVHISQNNIRFQELSNRRA